MSQSLCQIYIHLIFSTKKRIEWLKPDIREALGNYMAGILTAMNGHLLTFGAVSDHVHLLYSQPKDYTVIKVVEKLKANSSRWTKGNGPFYDEFQWQSGYGAFSVSASRIGMVRRYILGQEEHHQKHSFQDEFREFLKKYRIEYDERYVWD